MKPVKPRATKIDTTQFTMADLDALLNPTPPVDVSKLTVEQALALLRQLREVFK